MTKDELSCRTAFDWHQIEKDAHALGRKLQTKKLPFTWIVAVSRGGLTPAHIVAHVLGCVHVDTLCIESYDANNNQDIAVIHKLPQEWVPANQMLIIDDIVDSGKTVDVIKRLLPRCHFACLYLKREHALVDTFAKTCFNAGWLQMPWERV